MIVLEEFLRFGYEKRRLKADMFYEESLIYALILGLVYLLKLTAGWLYCRRIQFSLDCTEFFFFCEHVSLFPRNKKRNRKKEVKKDEREKDERERENN
jgi:hypothetical protein